MFEEQKSIVVTVVQEHGWVIWAAPLVATIIGGLILKWLTRRK